MVSLTIIRVKRYVIVLNVILIFNSNVPSKIKEKNFR
jgi:hypothetical protein